MFTSPFNNFYSAPKSYEPPRHAKVSLTMRGKEEIPFEVNFAKSTVQFVIHRLNGVLDTPFLLKRTITCLYSKS